MTGFFYWYSRCNCDVRVHYIDAAAATFYWGFWRNFVYFCFICECMLCNDATIKPALCTFLLLFLWLFCVQLHISTLIFGFYIFGIISNDLLSRKVNIFIYIYIYIYTHTAYFTASFHVRPPTWYIFQMVFIFCDWREVRRISTTESSFQEANRIFLTCGGEKKPEQNIKRMDYLVYRIQKKENVKSGTVGLI